MAAYLDISVQQLCSVHVLQGLEHLHAANALSVGIDANLTLPAFARCIV